MPKKLQRPEAAPLLCGGITVYSPLREFLSKGQTRVGVVGLGGLGHLAVKFASAMGCEVTVFSSSKNKKDEAEKMGADRFVVSSDAKAMKSEQDRLDLIIVTANVDLPWEQYLECLRGDGTLCFVGVPPSAISFGVFQLLGKRRRVAASPIGGRARISEMLEFAAQHDIVATSEIFPMADANDALKRLRKNDLRYRAVLVNPS
jgi:alcohol/geraniol dehydrogenase (NADP+)